MEASEAAALELVPLHERAVGRLIRAARLQRNNASALWAFEKYEAQLQADMQVAPSQAIRRLVTDVL